VDAVAESTVDAGGLSSMWVGVTTRFVRIVGVERATTYGYSLWELDVHGD
jgi:hyaluronoglucosaminidase